MTVEKAMAAIKKLSYNEKLRLNEMLKKLENQQHHASLQNVRKAE